MYCILELSPDNIYSYTIQTESAMYNVNDQRSKGQMFKFYIVLFPVKSTGARKGGISVLVTAGARSLLVLAKVEQQLPEL